MLCVQATTSLKHYPVYLWVGVQIGAAFVCVYRLGFWRCSLGWIVLLATNTHHGAHSAVRAMSPSARGLRPLLIPWHTRAHLPEYAIGENSSFEPSWYSAAADAGAAGCSSTAAAASAAATRGAACFRGPWWTCCSSGARAASAALTRAWACAQGGRRCLLRVRADQQLVRPAAARLSTAAGGEAPNIPSSTLITRVP